MGSDVTHSSAVVPYLQTVRFTVLLLLGLFGYTLSPPLGLPPGSMRECLPQRRCIDTVSLHDLDHCSSDNTLLRPRAYADMTSDCSELSSRRSRTTGAFALAPRRGSA